MVVVARNFISPLLFVGLVVVVTAGGRSSSAFVESFHPPSGAAVGIQPEGYFEVFLTLNWGAVSDVVDPMALVYSSERHFQSIVPPEQRHVLQVPVTAEGSYDISVVVIDVDGVEYESGGARALYRASRSILPDAGKSEVSHRPEAMLVGQVVVIGMVLRDMNGNPTHEAPNLVLSLSPPPLKSEMSWNASSQRFEARVQMEYAATHEFIIKIGENHIAGSPFEQEVLPPYNVGVVGSMAPGHSIADSQAVDALVTEKFAIVTVLTSDSFVTGALVLLYSIWANGGVEGVPTIAMVTAGVSQAQRLQLELAGWQIMPVDAIRCNSSDVVEERWRENYTKFRIFKMQQFSKVLYLDADTLVLNNIAEAFDCRSALCGVPDAWLPVFFNGGVLVLTPDEHTFDDLMRVVDRLPAHESEQSALNEFYYRRWEALDYTMNFQKNKGLTPSRFELYVSAHIQDVRIVHYMGHKPWFCSRQRDCMHHQPHYHHEGLYQLWWGYFDRMCETGAVECTTSTQ